MLSTTALSVKQIGIAVGYDDPSHFTMRFRKEFGLSPRRYRALPRQQKLDWE
jgi:transcriptional regulator GlxA family with amidase domain